MSAEDNVVGKDRLVAVTEFLMFVDRLKTIERKGVVPGMNRRETVAEHCWHMALAALLLQREISFKADLGRTLALVAVHDLVEIEAGDTYAYDVSGVAGQAEREEAAAAKLFGMLPPDLGADLDAMWREFEAGVTPEARLAKACDRLQGFMQNIIAKGVVWKENRIDRARTALRTDFPRSVDPAIAEVIEILYAQADEQEMWG
ncbi:MAG TPA: HD domain-containing protein [Geminicoccus sp.]|jgi:putative hydrolase of HD superfamily|uniref:HD domain-containing protein n=1 Tax=Geminicoccus sp. TaxID=2024832 RepID=UPI002E37DDDC|nr:HD domain-containing protein [Geminicoccus sp.]HEX2528414.1 HD domain-containing protein [Geminicoccus sp.]